MVSIILRKSKFGQIKAQYSCMWNTLIFYGYKRKRLLPFGSVTCQKYRVTFKNICVHYQDLSTIKKTEKTWQLLWSKYAQNFSRPRRYFSTSGSVSLTIFDPGRSENVPSTIETVQVRNKKHHSEQTTFQHGEKRANLISNRGKFALCKSVQIYHPIKMLWNRTWSSFRVTSSNSQTFREN